MVDFIVRAVDDVLKSEFGLADGLADTSKVTVDWDTGTNDPKTGKAVTIKKEVHKVQILDPATGTGTFLAKAVQLISDRVKARAPGKWSGYVEQDLLPRLHGFELLMASYAMCHMKLDMQLEQTGYKPSANPPRLSVWLTNALEPAEREVRDLFFAPLAEEARGASEVKRQAPIMCVIGNPPYSGESSNKGDHIMALMEAYKKEPGGKERLRERNPKWINDDYVKFIRMAEDLIAKNPSGGVLGFITNHGYLDNPTFRGMRWHLLRTFDKIWVIDLHGNSKKQEASPDGSPDKNVFDIQQGVALIVAVRKGMSSDALATVMHGEMWGSRADKYAALWTETREMASKTRLPVEAPQYPFVVRNGLLEQAYRGGFGVADLLPVNAVGIVTARDALTIDMDRQTLWQRVQDFAHLAPEEARRKYALGADVQDWSVATAQADVLANFGDNHLARIAYRPLDTRWTYFTGTSRGFQCRPRTEVMRHLASLPNLALMTPKQTKDGIGGLVNDGLAGHKSFSGFDITSNFPLYLYPSEAVEQADAFAPKRRMPNLNPKLYTAICTSAGIDSTDQAGPDDDFRTAARDARPSEVKVFDYIYGALHAPNYRKTYAEFLKIDFPRIPYPKSPEVFRHVSDKGEALRRLHLMEATAIGEAPYRYDGPDDGDDVVASGFPKWEKSATPDQVRGDEGGAPVWGRVFINADQYFDNVPEIAWNFPIGGYQPAQKWLKDRRGRALSFEDIGHYQKIVKILIETDRIMKEIELPLE